MILQNLLKNQASVSSLYQNLREGEQNYIGRSWAYIDSTSTQDHYLSLDCLWFNDQMTNKDLLTTMYYVCIFCKELSQRWPQPTFDFLFADLTSLTFSMHFNTVQLWPGGSWKFFKVSNWRNFITPILGLAILFWWIKCYCLFSKYVNV